MISFSTNSIPFPFFADINISVTLFCSSTLDCCFSKSILFLITIISLSSGNSFFNLFSKLKLLSVTSTIINVISASLIDSQVFSIPSFSTISPVSLKPAVSVK